MMKKILICLVLIFSMCLIAACDVETDTETGTGTDTGTDSDTVIESKTEITSSDESELSDSERSETAQTEKVTESDTEKSTETEIPVETETEDPRMLEDYAPVLYLNSKDIYDLTADGIYDESPSLCLGYDEVSFHKGEDGISYTKILVYNDYRSAAEAYFSVVTEPTDVAPIVAVKYRTTTSGVWSEVYTSSTNLSVTGGSNTTFTLETDGEWHVAIVNLAAKIASFDGTRANHFRFDFVNASVLPIDSYVDFAYIAFFNSEEDAKLFEYGEAEEVVYIDPVSGYTESKLPYGSSLDMINGMGEAGATSFSYRGGNSSNGVDVFQFNGTTLDGANLVFSGWSVVEGGIEKYVWSADGGKTWHDVNLHGKNEIPAGTDAHVTTAAVRIGNGFQFADPEASKLHVLYQCTAGLGANAQGLAACLTDYLGQTVNVTFAAVPATEENTLCLIAHVVGVKVVDVAEEESEEETGEVIEPTVDPSECADHVASKNWYPLIGETKEQKLCTKCGAAVETRDTAFAYAVDYIEHNGGESTRVKGPYGTEGSTIDGTNIVPRTGAVDIIMGGWLACNGGVEKLVYQVNGGEWLECGNQPSASGTLDAAVLAAVEKYALGITDYESPGRLRVTAPLSNYKGQTVTVVFGFIPRNNPTVTVPIVSVTNVSVPAN